MFVCLLNDDQMLTIENTDQVIKKHVTYETRMIDTKTTVLLGDTSNDDTPEVLTLKGQLTQMTVMMATCTAATSHPTDGVSRHKRARANKNGKTHDCVQGRHHVSYVQVEWIRRKRLLSCLKSKDEERH